MWIVVFCPNLSSAQCTANGSVSSPILCNGGTATVTIVAAGGTAPYSFTFNGQNNSTGVFTGILAGTAQAYSVTDALGCGPVTGTIDIVEPSAITFVSGPVITNTCVGTNNGKMVVSATGGTGTISYSINPAIGSQSPAGTFNNLTAQTYIITATDENLCTSTTSITVGTIPNPTITLSTTPGTLGQTVCSGSIIELVAFSIGGGGTGATITAGALPAGVNGVYSAGIFTISGTPTASGTFNYTISTTGLCTQATVSATITVNPILPVSVSMVASANPVCAGTSVTFAATPTNGGITPAYQWKVNGTNQGTNSSTFSYIPVNNDIITVALTSSETCKSGSPATSNAVTEIVNPVPTVTSPGPLSFCNGVATPVIPLSGTPAGVVFDLSGGASIGLANRTGVTEIPSFAAIKNTAVITLIPRANGCTGLPVTFTATVNAIPNVSSSPASQTICSDQATGITINSSTGGATFTWAVGAIVPAGSITGASSGSGNSINQQLTNNTAANATVTYVITPSANGCNGSPLNVVITVKPTPILVINDPSPVCSPTTIDLTAPSVTAGSSAGLSYSYWTNVTATAPLASPGAVVNGTNYIKGVDPATGCSSIKPVHSIVNAALVLTINNPAPVCAPATIDLTSPAITAGSTPGLSLTYWTDAAATISYATPATADDETFYIKATLGGCSVIKPVTVSVYSTLGIPVFSLGSSSSICKGSGPITYSATATNSMGITYSLDAASLAGGNTINSGNGQVTYAAGWAGTSQITATATGCGAPTQAIHTVKVNIPPTVTLAASTAGPACEGTAITLTVTNSIGSSMQTFTGTSGNINLAIPNNAHNAYSYSGITLSGSGGSILTSLDIVMITVNINHNTDSDLDIFLVDPQGTRAMLLSSANGGNGNNYTNTVFQTSAINPIVNGSAPFTGTFLPEGSVTTVPDRTGASGGGNYNSVIPANALNGASIDGLWTLRVFDHKAGNSGTLVNWSLSVTRQVDSGFITTINGPQTIGAVAYSGLFNSIATATVTPPAGTNIYTATTTNTDGCSTTSAPVAIVINPIPQPTVTADYCSVPGKIRLTAMGGGTYSWLPPLNSTSNFIDVDVAGNYGVVVTNGGCSATKYLGVSNELVVNGDFSSGNTGFSSAYGYAAPATNSLVPEGLYSVYTNPNFTHSNFWGKDHTTNTGNMMIINGSGSNPPVAVWQETTPVVPGINYYFSAWAISLNSVPPYAQLQFNVNGTLVGTTAVLPARAQNNNAPYNWVQFYGMWNSGSATTATIQIVDLQTAIGGNDFGLDDISFGTLAQIPAKVNISAAGSFCEGSTISLSATITGGRPPFSFLWTGPLGFTSNLSSPNIPNATLAHGGQYKVTLTDGYGCAPIEKPFNVVIEPKATANAGPDQSTCASSPSVTLAGILGGSATSGTWSGGNGSYNPNSTTLNAIYTPSAAEIAAGSVTLTLTTDDPAGTCGPVTDQVKITIYPAVTAHIIFGAGPVCNGGSDGHATASASGGISPYLYSWNSVPVQTTATATNLKAGKYTLTITDSHGCTGTDTITLVQPPALVVDEVIAFTQPTCFGGNDGSAKVTVTSGNSPTFLWSNGQTTATATGLAAGTYNVTITAANGCSATVLPVIITQPEPPTISAPADITVQADVGFNYASNVQVPLPVYVNACSISSRLWEMTGSTIDKSPTSGTNTPGNHNFNVGNTTVKYSIFDGAGNISTCSFQVNVIGEADIKVDLTGPPVIIAGSAIQYTLTVTNLGPSVAPIVTVNESIPPSVTNLNFTVDGGSLSPWTGSLVLNNLAVNEIHTLVISGKVDCASMTQFTATAVLLPISDPVSLNNTASVTTTLSQALTIASTVVPVSCPGKTDGNISITVTGGASPYSFTWNGPGAFTSNSKDISSLAPGVYDLTVIDNNGCSKNISVTMTTNPDITSPTFSAPAGPFAFCVNNLISATYLAGNIKINPEPDYYLFKAGNTALDLDPVLLNFNDNCTARNQLIINWRIDFAQTPNPTPPPIWLTHASISGTGQPSASLTDMVFPGDGINFTTIAHTITYWLIDTNGNKSIDQTVSIFIKPRPKLVKNNHP